MLTLRRVPDLIERFRAAQVRMAQLRMSEATPASLWLTPCTYSLTRPTNSLEGGAVAATSKNSCQARTVLSWSGLPRVCLSNCQGNGRCQL